MTHKVYLRIQSPVVCSIGIQETRRITAAIGFEAPFIETMAFENAIGIGVSGSVGGYVLRYVNEVAPYRMDEIDELSLFELDYRPITEDD